MTDYTSLANALQTTLTADAWLGNSGNVKTIEIHRRGFSLQDAKDAQFFSHTDLPAIAISLVPNTLLGTWADDDSGSEVEDFGPYLGKYIANFATFSNEVFTVLERDGHLAVDVPSQMVFDLKPPDEDGKWQFTLTDEIAVSFERDEAGDVVAMTMYQSGKIRDNA